MAAAPDYDLRQTGEGDLPPVETPPDGATRLWIAIAVLAAIAGAALYVFVLRPEAPAPAAEAPAAIAEPAPPPQPLGAEPYPVKVPPLDLSDAIVRELLQKLSSHPRVVAWLATDGLVRNFASTVLNIAEGRVPATGLSALRPAMPIRIVSRDGAQFVDPRSFQRYDAVADAIRSVSPADAARLFATLKPRLEEAHRELGVPETSFEATLERAIVLLLQTPPSGEQVSVQPMSTGIGYAFSDARLEALTAAQRQLLRMGPRNVRIVQDSLRQMALAVGISASRLPASRPAA